MFIIILAHTLYHYSNIYFQHKKKCENKEIKIYSIVRITILNRIARDDSIYIENAFLCYSFLNTSTFYKSCSVGLNLQNKYFSIFVKTIFRTTFSEKLKKYIFLKK